MPVNGSSPAPGSSGAAAASRAGSTRLAFSGCRAFPQVNGCRIDSAACSRFLEDLVVAGGVGFGLGGAARRALPGVARAGRHSVSDVQGNGSPRRVGGPPRLRFDDQITWPTATGAGLRFRW